jgi:DNA-binding MarR family transcriptional regulator
LRALSVLREITGKIAPGRPPAYTTAHALMGLEMIGAGLGVGRQQLSRELRLGEGTIRTMVTRMKSLGLVEATRGGMSLTEEGREVLAEANQMISSSEIPETSLTVGSNNHAVLVRGASAKVGLGIEQRDAALIAGALGATTLICKGGGLLIPGTSEKLDPEINRLILARLSPGEGDAIIVGSSDDPYLAELGAKSAALELLRD